MPPLPRQPREGRVLARLGGEILHDLISRERIRQARAQRRVEPLLRLSGGRDPIDREAHADRKIDCNSDRHDAAEQRPARHQQRCRADDDDSGGENSKKQRIAELVERPHAARDLAHRGAGEGIGVPVRGKTLNAGEGVPHQRLHRARRHINDRPSDDRAQCMKGDHQTDEMSERAQSGGQIAAARRQRVDKRARGERNKNIDQIRRDSRCHHQTE